MNDWARLRREAQRNKEIYPAGTRIQLIFMDDPHAPVPEGTRGTVIHVDDIGQLSMRWDNGRTLSVVPGVDSFRKLTPQELEEEHNAASLAEKMKAAASRTGNRHKSGEAPSKDPHPDPQR